MDVLNCREEGADPGGREFRRGGIRLPGVGVGREGALRVVEDWVQAWATSEDTGCEGHVQGQLPCGCAWRSAGTQPFGMPQRSVALRHNDPPGYGWLRLKQTDSDPRSSLNHRRRGCVRNARGPQGPCFPALWAGSCGPQGPCFPALWTGSWRFPPWPFPLQAPPVHIPPPPGHPLRPPGHTAFLTQRPGAVSRPLPPCSGPGQAGGVVGASAP